MVSGKPGAVHLASADLLERTGRGPDDQRLVRIVLRIAAAEVGPTLDEIGRRVCEEPAGSD